SSKGAGGAKASHHAAVCFGGCGDYVSGRPARDFDVVHPREHPSTAAVPGGDDGRSDQSNGYSPSAVGKCRLSRNEHSHGDRLVERALAGIAGCANGPDRIASLRVNGFNPLQANTGLKALLLCPLPPGEGRARSVARRSGEGLDRKSEILGSAT